MNSLRKYGLLAILYLVAILPQACQNPFSDENPAEEDAIAVASVLFLLQNRDNRGPAKYDCSQVQNFQDLMRAGTEDVCSQCHSVSLPTNNFVITDYELVRSKTIPGSPEGSFLYTKITEGSMRFQANDAIREAVYCWIWNGSRP